jgi:hypothetical protein
MNTLPVANLVALAGCVSVFAAIILAALPNFRPEIESFRNRVGIFLAIYTIPVVSLQTIILLILIHIKGP